MVGRMTGERFSAIADPRPADSVWPQLAWPPQPGVRLLGCVVQLTPFDPSQDAAVLFAALDHDLVWRHVAGRPQDPNHYASSLGQQLAAGRFPWVVRLVRSTAGIAKGTVVGTSSYLEVSDGDARLEIGSTAYTPGVWATSVNPDTKLQLLRYAFEELGAGRVQLKTDVRNIRSQQAIARLGAQYEGTLRRYQRRADGTVRDTVLFSILAQDWPAIRDGLLARLDASDARE
jgi:RimJ/RimL family protein N-acetyltransferase